PLRKTKDARVLLASYHPIGIGTGGHEPEPTAGKEREEGGGTTIGEPPPPLPVTLRQVGDENPADGDSASEVDSGKTGHTKNRRGNPNPSRTPARAPDVLA